MSKILVFILLLPNWILSMDATNSESEFYIKDGRKLYLNCSGKGSPSVIFISGQTKGADTWKSGSPDVFSAVAKFTQACVYDRPGTLNSRSSTVSQPTTPQNGVDDLHELLTAAKISPPYILVGHSYGGLIAKLYTSLYPDEVVGLVFVDALTEMFYEALNPFNQQILKAFNSEYVTRAATSTRESVDYTKSFEQLKRAPGLPAIPITVITSDRSYNFQILYDRGLLPENSPVQLGEIVFQAHLKGQDMLAERVKAKHIKGINSGHYIQYEQPQIVIDAIKKIYDQTK